MSLANKYRPKTFEDVTEQKIIVDMLKSLCTSDRLSCRNFLLIGPAGCGKANTLDTDILTTHGYVKMKDIRIGDKVFTHTGSVGSVSGIFPQGKKPVYRITLQDRSYIDVSDEHLNLVYRYNEDRKCREDFCITTKELIELYQTSRFKLRVDIPLINWKHQDVPIDPYLLGALLGDGSLHFSLGFYNSEADILSKINFILNRDFDMSLRKIPNQDVDYYIVTNYDTTYKYLIQYKNAAYKGTNAVLKKLRGDGYIVSEEDILNLVSNHNCNNCRLFAKYPELRESIYLIEINPNYHCNPLFNEIRKLGLNVSVKQKFIPKQYLYNDFECRLELLRGLFDTDGYTDKQGATDWTTTSEQMSDDFAFLARSLGIRDTVTKSPSVYVTQDGNHKVCGWAFTHHLKFPNYMVYCSSNKHLNRRIARQNDPMRNIVSIEYIGEQDCQCIMVDHKDHSYICNSGMIPTHNTTLGRIMSNVLNNNQGEPIELDAASHGSIEEVRSLIEQAKQYPIGQKYKVIIADECHSFSNACWQTLLKILEDGAGRTIWVFCTTNPEKIPATILSRVQTFQLSKISLEGIQNRLKYVIDCENNEGAGIIYEEDAVNYIAKLANGGMRDSLTLLDKALAYSKDLSSSTITQALNLPEYDDFFKLLQSYAKKDNVAIAKLVDEVYNSGVNFVKWMESFHSFVMQVVKYILLQDINKTMIPTIYKDKIAKYSSKHLIICLNLANKLLKMNQELKTTQYLQEVTLTHLCFLPKKEV